MAAAGSRSDSGPGPALADVRLYLITGETRSRALDGALGAIPPGSAAVQVRAKDLGTRPLFDLARRVVAIARPHRAPVLVNDRLDIALAAGADGVHLPEAGFSVANARAAAGPAPILVGRSTHAPDDALAATDADLVVLGPIFETPSKRGYGPPLGPSALRAASAPLGDRGTRLFALGGITDTARARECARAGAHGVAAIRGLLDAPDPAASARALFDALDALV